MKKTVIAIFFCTALCTAVFAQNASDFKTDGKGTITGYEGWDKVITIPEKIGNVTITAIATKAFERLDFTDLTLPASIKTIGESAFSGSKLTSITLPSGVTIGDRTFASNQLTSLTIPSGVTIGEGAFSNNNLTSLTILADVTIGVSAFADNKLNTIAVGDRVTIDAGSFYGNPLTSVTIGSGGIIYTGYDRYITFNNSNLKTLNLGEGINFKSTVFNIGAYYDYLCNSKKAGTYDNTVRYSEKTEGDYTFIPTTYGAVITRYNGGLQAVQIPAVLGGKAVKGIVGEDYVGAFMRRNITRIQLPDGLAFIDGGAFSDNQLTSVTIPDSVTSIGDNAFSSNQLTSVNIPNRVTSIGEEAFYQNQLTSVTIPNSVTFIGEKTFENNQLASVTISNDNTVFGNNHSVMAFTNNPLVSITLPANFAFKAKYYDKIRPNYDIFPNNFGAFYESQGKKAGTYMWSGRLWRIATAADLEQAKQGQASDQNNFQATHKVVTNDGSNLRLRNNPAFNAAQTGSLEYGSLVKALETGASAVDGDGNRGNWTYVTTPDGRTGWCFGAYLQSLPR